MGEQNADGKLDTSLLPGDKPKLLPPKNNF